jgi:osmotically-inducible protein OsmY
MKQLLLAAMLVCLSFQIGCTTNQESKSQAAREPARMTDTDLKNKIETQLNSDPQLREANLSISADADANRATVSGTVETEALRTKAVEAAKASNPGLIVEDKIDVKPHEVARSEYTAEMARTEVERAKTHHETVGGTLDDAWIHSKIVGQLIGDKDTPERKINVDVDHGVVTLRGAVETAEQKQEAGRIAKETDGVKRVNNLLKVSQG